MTFRSALKETIYAAAALSGLARRAGAHRGPGLVVLTHHSIGPAGRYPYLGRIPVTRLRAQICHLRAHYDLVPLAEGLQRLATGNVSRTMAAITVDDGYGDNYTELFPLLQEERVPATIFLATDYLDSGRLPWPTRISALLHHATVRRLDIGGTAMDIASPEQRARAGRRLRELYSRLDRDAREVEMDRLAKALAPQEMTVLPPLGWNEVRKMREAGVSFGAHTRYHAWLDRVSSAELALELRAAQQRIETELEQPCDFLAYPNGNHDATVRAAAVAAGYRYGLTQDRGINRNITDPMALHRIEVPFDERLGSFICRTAGFTIR